MSSHETDSSLERDDSNTSIEDDTGGVDQPNNDGLISSAKYITDLIDKQATFEFENIDVKIQGGDVQIILSEDEADDVILPSSLLRTSRYFDHAFSGNWNTGGSIKKIKCPETQKVVDVYRWSLRETRVVNEKYDTVYLLENGTKRSLIDGEKSWPRSFWASRDGITIPGFRNNPAPKFKTLERAIIAHKVFFALLVQQDFDWPADVRFRNGILAEVLSYATFYGLYDRIARELCEVAPCLVWEDIAEHPEFYFGLSQVLREEAMWYEALRHIVGDFCFHKRQPCGYPADKRLDDLSEIDYCDLKLLVLEHREDLQLLTGSILTRLQELVTFPDPQFSCTDRFLGVVRQTFLARREVQHKYWTQSWKINGRTPRERLGHVARSVFGEWLSHELVRAAGTYDRGCKVVRQNRIFAAYKELLRAHETDDISIFGKRAPERLAEMFGQKSMSAKHPKKPQTGGKRNHKSNMEGAGDTGVVKDGEDKKPSQTDAEILEMLLKRILRDAAGIIKCGLDKNPKIKPVHSEVGYFTHIAAEEISVPWAMKPDFLEVEGLDLKRASQEWLDLVHGEEWMGEHESDDSGNNAEKSEISPGADCAEASVFGKVEF
ncbi:hypothetical protein Vi05172_g6211 [Venturia inaequalis]|nr:hypothetical protein Vi05172_g6211 [Venturia inaequalis]